MKIYKPLKTLRSALLVFLTHQLALPMLKLLRKPELFPYSETELEELPVDTVGHELILFLQSRQLQLLPYYAKHDIKHILLQYDATDEGEVCLQCFMLGNGHISFPVAATVAYGFVTMPEYWSSFRKAFRRGRQSIAISGWEWHKLVAQPVAELRNKINHHLNDQL